MIMIVGLLGAYSRLTFMVAFGWLFETDSCFIDVHVKNGWRDLLSSHVSLMHHV